MKRIFTPLIAFLLTAFPIILRAQHVVVYNDTVCDTEDHGVLRTNIMSLMTSAYETDTITYNYDSDFTNASDVLQQGVPLAIDDRYSDAIDIGFTFQFFGQPYTQLVIGSNGDIVFEPSVADQYDHWRLRSYQTIPNIELPYYYNGVSYPSIMGAFHDIDAGRRIAGTSELKYELRGTAPNRKFIITYHMIPQFSCNNLLTSQQIVLNESDYSIEVHIKNKEVCSGWNSGLATLGVQNADATCGYFPGDNTTPNSTPLRSRNTGVWTVIDGSISNPPEAWVFRPASQPTIRWYDSNRQVIPNATADSLVVSTSGDLGPYTCEVTYSDCNGNTQTEYAEGQVVVVPTPVVDLGADQKKCSADEITLDATPSNINDFTNYPLSYQWYKDGQPIQGANSATYTVSEPGTYSVEVSTGRCSTTDEIVIENYLNTACVIPEVITPNGDGKNDTFVLDFLDGQYGISKIEIFNRWGSKVFEKSDGYTNEWHGQNTNGKDLPAAAYFYVVQLKNGDKKTGWVYIIR